MTLLLDKPDLGLNLPDLEELTEGPQYVDVMLLGYHKPRRSDEHELYLAINEDGGVVSFNNTLRIIKISPSSESYNKSCKKLWGVETDYQIQEKKLENARLECEGKKRLLQGRIGEKNPGKGI